MSVSVCLLWKCNEDTTVAFDPEKLSIWTLEESISSRLIDFANVLKIKGSLP